MNGGSQCPVACRIGNVGQTARRLDRGRNGNPLESVIQEGRDGPVAAIGRPAAKDNRDNALPVALGRANQVVSRLPDVTGFDAVSALVGGKQGVMVFVAVATPLKAACRKLPIIVGMVAQQCHGQLAHVTRRGNLAAVMQSRRVSECRVIHAELPGLSRHGPGEIPLGARHRLGQDDRRVIGRFGDQGQDGLAGLDGLAFPQSQPRRALPGGESRNAECLAGL